MAAYLVPDIFGQSAGAYNIDDQGLRYLLSMYLQSVLFIISSGDNFFTRLCQEI